MYAQILNPKPHQMMTCPYNPAHQVEHYRMHIHLQKCRKQHPSTSTTSCAFDATHKVPYAELDYHVSTCPKRAMFDNQLYVIDDGVPMREVPVTPVPPTTSSNDDWDDDQTTSYVPNPARKAHIITKIKGATPSERRQARMEGVRNFRPLNG